MPDPAPGQPRHTLPEFTPVRRQKSRSNGWSPAVQRAFIEALAETGSVRAACRRVGRADHGAYLLRRHPEAESFRAAWAAALDIGIQRIEDVAMDRAINGTQEPVYSYGKLVGSRTRYNDRLLMFMLRNRAPERFAGGGARGLTALDRQTLARLKREWEQEREAQELEEEAATRESLDRFLGAMRDRRLSAMSPAQRRAQIAADAQARADQAAGWRPGAPYAEYQASAAELLPKFLAEVEAEWPPLEAWVWQGYGAEDDAEAPPSPRPSPRPRGRRTRRTSRPTARASAGSRTTGGKARLAPSASDGLRSKR